MGCLPPRPACRARGEQPSSAPAVQGECGDERLAHLAGLEEPVRRVQQVLAIQHLLAQPRRQGPRAQVGPEQRARHRRGHVHLAAAAQHQRHRLAKVVRHLQRRVQRGQQHGHHVRWQPIHPGELRARHAHLAQRPQRAGDIPREQPGQVPQFLRERLVMHRRRQRQGLAEGRRRERLLLHAQRHRLSERGGRGGTRGVLVRHHREHARVVGQARAAAFEEAHHHGPAEHRGALEAQGRPGTHPRRAPGQPLERLGEPLGRLEDDALLPQPREVRRGAAPIHLALADDALAGGQEQLRVVGELPLGEPAARARGEVIRQMGEPREACRGNTPQGKPQGIPDGEPQERRVEPVLALGGSQRHRKREINRGSAEDQPNRAARQRRASASSSGAVPASTPRGNGGRVWYRTPRPRGKPHTQLRVAVAPPIHHRSRAAAPRRTSASPRRSCAPSRGAPRPAPADTGHPRRTSP
ncbi:hypothetical protein STIAU_0642 [Stigmatella aurantiaca DW4/3-1]|uniref:Uncharacterized protein n=1 Tax=Stigmatella aurantiaca (strain DW4/3-1) TaxID=378806 RepID=Q08P29_STIAD|nr:hypothetical protein STIAU_0642 [Stigmatella aurantiaca DW4/3-1]